MNAPHIHLLINHLPIIGLIIGILVVIFGLLTKKQVVSSVGLWITMIAGLSSYPTVGFLAMYCNGCICWDSIVWSQKRTQTHQKSRDFSGFYRNCRHNPNW